jgi:hypothetical protein
MEAKYSEVQQRRFALVGELYSFSAGLDGEKQVEECCAAWIKRD